MRRVIATVQDEEDIDLLMFANVYGFLSPLRCKITKEHRESIDHGSIIIFNEQQMSLQRWIDGKEWGPSKKIGDFLIYREKTKRSKHSSKNRDVARKQADTTKWEDFHRSDALFKKSIKVTILNEAWHIYAYFRPSRQQTCVKELPFFAQLKNKINLKDMLSVPMNERKTIRELVEEYKINNVWSYSTIPNGLKILKEIAAEGLAKLFNLCKEEQ